MILSLEQIKQITVGAVHTEESDGKLRFFKYSPDMLQAWKDFDEVFASRTRATTGVRLDFHTNARHMTVKIEEL